MAAVEEIIDIPAEHIKNVFGEFDKYLKTIEQTLHVTIISRGGTLRILGDSDCTDRASYVLSQLIHISENGDSITQQMVDYTVDLALAGENSDVRSLYGEIICHTVNGKPVKPKTHGQKLYVNDIRDKMIVFGVGPAGTGKTYLAMAMAITAFKNKEVNRIILTRPAMEAGERLGFLPGDLQSKIDPYLRPLYDALYDIMGAEAFQKNTEKGLIEVAPLAYMRGRTLDNSFIVLDEAQNTTPAQMKMFLTRIGFGSKVVVTGDLTQKDLEKDQTSGLDVALKILPGIPEIGICMLTSRDVVRHPVVQKIVKAYDDYEESQLRARKARTARIKNNDGKHNERKRKDI